MVVPSSIGARSPRRRWIKQDVASHAFSACLVFVICSRIPSPLAYIQLPTSLGQKPLPGATLHDAKVSMILPLNVAMMPLLFRCSAAVMPLLFSSRFEWATQKNIHIFSGLTRETVGWTRDSEKTA